MTKITAKEIDDIYKAYEKYYGEVPEWVRTMGEGAPDALYHYFQLRVIGLEDGVLPRKVKELILLGANLVRRYEAGIRVHTKGALEAGASREEILETIVTAMVSGAACAVIDGPAILTEELNRRDRRTP